MALSSEGVEAAVQEGIAIMREKGDPPFDRRQAAEFRTNVWRILLAADKEHDRVHGHE